MKTRIRAGSTLIVALTLGAAISIASFPPRADEIKFGRFPPLSAINSTLQRGITRDVVRRALGEPSGFGQTRMPPDHTPHEVWYYEHIEIEGAVNRQDYVNMELRQQILLVFFDGDRVNGYLWTSNEGMGEAKIK